MQAQPLLGQSAFITGGARRIGRAIAQTLATAGADVTLTYLASEADANDAVAEMTALGRRAQAVRCDVRSEYSVQEAVAAAVAFHGRLDVLVNNAGVFQSKPLDQVTLEDWDAAFETNTRGPFLTARECLPHLRTQRGRIVNLGSLGGIRPWATHAHYCASKAALHMLTLAMAKAFAPEVTANCVAPGWIEMEEEHGQTSGRFAQKTPLGRNGSAADVARAVLYFAAEAPFVTGQVLTVDGGLSLS